MTKTLIQSRKASCECGCCQFEIRSQRLARFICHCTICQSYTGNAFGDVAVVRAGSVEVTGKENIAFRKYRLPPNISRGLCRSCGKPAIEYGGFGPGKVALIPAANFAPDDHLPTPSMHIFYHRRKADSYDSLPKYSGYFRSEFAVGGLIMKVLRR